MGPGSYPGVASASQPCHWLVPDFMGCSHAQSLSASFAPGLNHLDGTRNQQQWRENAKCAWNQVYIVAMLIPSKSLPEEWLSTPVLFILLGYILTVRKFLTLLSEPAIKLMNFEGYPSICEGLYLQVSPKYFPFCKNESCSSHVMAWIYRLGKAA